MYQINLSQRNLQSLRRKEVPCQCTDPKIIQNSGKVADTSRVSVKNHNSLTLKIGFGNGQSNSELSAIKEKPGEEEDVSMKKNNVLQPFHQPQVQQSQHQNIDQPRKR